MGDSWFLDVLDEIKRDPLYAIEIIGIVLMAVVAIIIWRGISGICGCGGIKEKRRINLPPVVG